MSNALSIATVSAVLQGRLRSLLDAHGLAHFDVNTTPPVGEPDPGVYLHLFRVLPNVALQQEPLPTRRRDGTVVTRPRLALTLHYLLSFVGGSENTEFAAERLSGLVLSELHARPLLPPAEIATFVAGLPAGHVLSQADLGDQLDRVRFSLLAMDLEDLSRVWSMLNQSFHALTVGLEASAVLLEDEAEPSVPLTVATSAITVLPIASPQLLSAISSARAQPLVQLLPSGDAAGETLVLRGSGLIGPITRVRVGSSLFDVAPADRSASELRVALDAGSGVPSGVVSVQVIHEVDLDPDEVNTKLRRAGVSGSLAVALVPTVAVLAVEPDLGGQQIELLVSPLPLPEQEVQLLLDRVGGGGQLRSREFTVDGGSLRFRVNAPPAGEYLVRVVVGGATSLLRRDAPGLPTPHLTIP